MGLAYEYLDVYERHLQQVDFQPHTFSLGVTGHYCRDVGEGH